MSYMLKMKKALNCRYSVYLWFHGSSEKYLLQKSKGRGNCVIHLEDNRVGIWLSTLVYSFKILVCNNEVPILVI